MDISIISIEALGTGGTVWEDTEGTEHIAK